MLKSSFLMLKSKICILQSPCEYYLTKRIDSFKLIFCFSGGFVDVRGGSIWRKAIQGERG